VVVVLGLVLGVGLLLVVLVVVSRELPEMLAVVVAVVVLGPLRQDYSWHHHSPKCCGSVFPPVG
jgi:hypothetical protein